MALASSDTHGWLPHKLVIDAMSGLLSINSTRIAELETTISQQKSMLESLRSELTESYAIDAETERDTK